MFIGSLCIDTAVGNMALKVSVYRASWISVFKGSSVCAVRVLGSSNLKSSIVDSAFWNSV